MSIEFIDLVIFCLILSATIIFTIYKTSKCNENNIIDYMLCGRKLTMPLFVTSFVSTWYGDIFGMTQIAFNNGIGAIILYGIGFYFGAVIFMLFVVKKLGVHM